MNENDARVVRTKTSLRQALTMLVIREGFYTLTVQKIADEASISHKTFYRHYQDKEDLLNSVVQEYIDRYTAVFAPPVSLPVAEQNVNRMLQVAEKDADALRMLFHTADGYQLLNAVLKAAESIQDPPMWKQKDNLIIPASLLGYHFTAGLINLAHWWVDEEQPYPLEEMAYYINELVTRPTWRQSRRSAE